MKPLFALVAALIALGPLLHASAPRPLDDSFLAGIRAEAKQQHPAAIASKHRATSASLNARAVRLWNDPMVGFGFMGAAKMMRADEGDLMIGIEQSLPKPGMFAAEKAKMAAMHRSEMAISSASLLDTGALAATTAIELALADESITLQQSQVKWLTQMAENARQMAADPMAGGTDALRIETELAREKQVLDAAKRTRQGFAQSLNLILGRPLESPWPSLTLPATPPPVPLASTEVARIPFANPKVRAMREMVAAASADTRIADRERLPDVAVAADTQVYSGSADLKSTTVGVKLSLPWFNDPSYQARIAAAKSREAAAQQDVETMRREIAGRVVKAATEAANAAAQARAFAGEIHDKAVKAAQTTETAWISSSTPLNDVLDSARVLFSIRLEQRRMIAMQLAAVEELNALIPTHSAQ